MEKHFIKKYFLNSIRNNLNFPFMFVARESGDWNSDSIWGSRSSRREKEKNKIMKIPLLKSVENLQNIFHLFIYGYYENFPLS